MILFEGLPSEMAILRRQVDKLQDSNFTLNEENNLLRLKIEILLDMVKVLCLLLIDNEINKHNLIAGRIKC